MMHFLQVLTIKLFTNASFAFCAAAALRWGLRHMTAEVAWPDREVSFYYISRQV